MTTFSTEQQMLCFLYGSRARTTLRDARPVDPVALAAISTVLLLTMPGLEDMNAWEAAHGLPATSAEDYAKPRGLFEADIAAVAGRAETEH